MLDFSIFMEKKGKYKAF